MARPRQEAKTGFLSNITQTHLVFTVLSHAACSRRTSAWSSAIVCRIGSSDSSWKGVEQHIEASGRDLGNPGSPRCLLLKPIFDGVKLLHHFLPRRLAKRRGSLVFTASSEEERRRSVFAHGIALSRSAASRPFSTSVSRATLVKTYLPSGQVRRPSSRPQELCTGGCGSGKIQGAAAAGEPQLGRACSAVTFSCLISAPRAPSSFAWSRSVARFCSRNYMGSLPPASPDSQTGFGTGYQCDLSASSTYQAVA